MIHFALGMLKSGTKPMGIHLNIVLNVIWVLLTHFTKKHTQHLGLEGLKLNTTGLFLPHIMH